jgi:hypothetical protein
MTLLCEHMYRRLAPEPIPVEIPEEDLLNVRIYDSQLYAPVTISFNFTTYDMLRDTDVVNPKHARRTVLVHCPLREDNKDTHPWHYARVLRVFHAEVSLKSGASARKLDFLWVRWYRTDSSHVFGASTRRLE